jgi:hypothetical protein
MESPGTKARTFQTPIDDFDSVMEEFDRITDEFNSLVARQSNDFWSDPTSFDDASSEKWVSHPLNQRLTAAFEQAFDDQASYTTGYSSYQKSLGDANIVDTDGPEHLSQHPLSPGWEDCKVSYVDEPIRATSLTGWEDWDASFDNPGRAAPRPGWEDWNALVDEEGKVKLESGRAAREELTVRDPDPPQTPKTPVSTGRSYDDPRATSPTGWEDWDSSFDNPGRAAPPPEWEDLNARVDQEGNIWLEYASARREQSTIHDHGLPQTPRTPVQDWWPFDYPGPRERPPPGVLVPRRFCWRRPIYMCPRGPGLQATAEEADIFHGHIERMMASPVQRVPRARRR